MTMLRLSTLRRPRPTPRAMVVGRPVATGVVLVLVSVGVALLVTFIVVSTRSWLVGRAEEPAREPVEPAAEAPEEVG